MSGRASARLGLLRLAARGLAPTIEATRSPPERVLLLRPDHIGDVLLTSPAVALLRHSLPAARLTYIVGPWSLAAARHGPSVDSVRGLDFPGFSRRSGTVRLLAPYRLLAREAARLRREHFDLAVVFRPDHWWGALLAMTAGIPTRVGGQTPETRALLTHALPWPRQTHAADHALGLARLALTATGAPPRPAASGLAFCAGDTARQTAEQLWKAGGLTGRRVVALQPSAGAALKSWPVERWAEVADRLADWDLGVILTGAPADGSLLLAISAATIHRPVLAYGQALEVSAALFQKCALVIGPDSGAGHLAGAVGTPTVRLYGPAAVERFGPWPLTHSVDRGHSVLVASGLACRPCGHLDSPPCGAVVVPACMAAVGVDDVLKAVRARLDHG